MLILDTNHYSEIARKSGIGIRLEQRICDAGEDAFLTIVTAGEVMKGRLAAVQPHLQSDRGVQSFLELQNSITDIARWVVLPWTDDAADNFDSLKRMRIKTGTSDLRIASIAFEYDATVLTRNLSDFTCVPGLRVENWLD